LDPDPTLEVVRARLARHGTADEHVAHALAVQSGGNPLFLEQLAAEVLRSHGAAGALRKLTLTELIQERIGRFSSRMREFLHFLAVFGEPLPENLLLQLVPDDGDHRVAVSGLVVEN